MTFSEHFLKSLPAGADPKDVRIIRCAATVQPLEKLDPEEELILADYRQAQPEPINSTGKPTVMRVVAWMVHEGPNRNRQVFIKEELQAVAADLFKAPNFGVMDFNHAAVVPWSEDPKVIGLWYKADFAFDTKAGKWGILATGMMWSWLFPDHADLLLAEQVRHGKISFSMAAIPSSIEFTQLADSQGEILHNPVFFTVSALDVPPADPDATGLGSEDPEDDEDDITQRLLTLAQWTRATHIESPKQGEPMEQNELIQKLTEDRVQAEQAVRDLEAAHTTEKETLAKSVAELTAKVEELTTKVSELETVRDAVAAERADALAKIEQQDAELATLRAFKAEHDAKDAEKVQAELLAARIAELPETVRHIHAGRDDEARSRVEAKWLAMNEEEWKTYVQDELLPFVPKTRLSFLERSQLAASLPNIATDSEGDISTRAKSLLR